MSRPRQAPRLGRRELFLVDYPRNSTELKYSATCGTVAFGFLQAQFKKSKTEQVALILI